METCDQCEKSACTTIAVHGVPEVLAVLSAASRFKARTTGKKDNGQTTQNPGSARSLKFHADFVVKVLRQTGRRTQDDLWRISSGLQDQVQYRFVLGSGAPKGLHVLR